MYLHAVVNEQINRYILKYFPHLLHTHIIINLIEVRQKRSNNVY